MFQARLVTDYGSFPMPLYMVEHYKRARIRKDGQPDKRTKAGREWWRHFDRLNSISA
jgi:hypothetical protein